MEVDLRKIPNFKKHIETLVNNETRKVIVEKYNKTILKNNIIKVIDMEMEELFMKGVIPSQYVRTMY